MNRFELINELERVKSNDKTEELRREVERLHRENDKLHEDLEKCRSTLVIVAQHMDALGASDPNMRVYLDVADDIRRHQVKPPAAVVKRRSLKDRRVAAQGRRKATRRK